ncbi:hypothetical protein JCM8202_001871 [Rhodotorula sphaerocarpa]
MAATKQSNVTQSDLVAAALADPTVSVPGFDTSRLMALVAVALDNSGDKSVSRSRNSARKRLIRAVKTAYLFKVENGRGEEATWCLDVKKRGRVSVVKEGERPPVKPDVVIVIKDGDLIGLATGKLHPQKLYAAKRLHIRGDLDRAWLALRVLSQEREKLELAGRRGSEEGRGLGDQAGSPVRAKL